MNRVFMGFRDIFASLNITDFCHSENLEYSNALINVMPSVIYLICYREIAIFHELHTNFAFFQCIRFTTNENIENHYTQCEWFEVFLLLMKLMLIYPEDNLSGLSHYSHIRNHTNVHVATERTQLKIRRKQTWKYSCRIALASAAQTVYT